MLAAPAVLLAGWGIAVPPRGLESIGGRWYVGTPQPLATEAATRFRSLYRKSAGRHTLVDDRVADYKFYAPDCVIYATVREGRRPILAACDDHREVGVVRS